MAPGDKVRVLDPFAPGFLGVYVVESTESLEGGIVVHLEGVESAFAPEYLEVVK